MILKKSKFYGFCYADDIQEHEFFGKNFQVDIHESYLKISFEWVRGLDLDIIKTQINKYSFVEIEDFYLKEKLIGFLKLNFHKKKIKISINKELKPVKKLKFNKKGFELVF